MESLLTLLSGVVAGVATGAAGMSVVDGRIGRTPHMGPRYPEHWPAQSDWLDANDPTKFTTFSSPQAAALAGAAPIGRTIYTGRIPIPNRYGLRELRRKFVEARTTPIYLSETARFRHIAVMGITGGGKSTAFVYNWLAYDALAECSNVVIDVKSPEFFDVLYHPYRKNGKDVLLLDGWNKETLAIEPVYRSKSEELDRLATIIMSYSPAKGSGGGGDKNNEYFELQSEKLLRSLMELATHWPRRFCNLPCIQQCISAGGQTILESYKWARDNVPTAAQIVHATALLAGATPEEILGNPDPMHAGAGRAQPMADALALLDRCGFELQSRVRELRALWPSTPDANRAALLSAFEKQAERSSSQRRAALERYLINIGDFLQSPPETRNSVVASLANKMKPFTKPEIATLFSRDEVDLDALIKKPTLLIIGTPLGELPTGAGFVGSIISSLVLKLVENRRVRFANGETSINPDLPVHLVLDELPQLGIKNLPTNLVTLRSFRCGIICVYQDRAQLEMCYGQDVKSIEGNCATKILLPGLYGEAPKYVSDTVLGTARVVRVKAKKRRNKDGSNGDIAEHAETLPRMGADEVSQMRINGRVMAEAALQVGLPSPFPFGMTQYWNDQWVRDSVYGMQRTDTRVPWIKRLPIVSSARERWAPATRKEPYITRRQPHPDERPDPVRATVDFLLKTWFDERDEATATAGGARRRPEALAMPHLDLKAIGSKDIDLNAILAAQQAESGVAPAPEAPPAAAPVPAPPLAGMVAPGLVPATTPLPRPVPSLDDLRSLSPLATAASTGPALVDFGIPAVLPLARVMPRYSVDFREMTNDESAPVDSILSPGDVQAHTVQDYLRALDEMLFGDGGDSDSALGDPDAFDGSDPDALPATTPDPDTDFLLQGLD